MSLHSVIEGHAGEIGALKAEILRHEARYRDAVELNPQIPWTASGDGAVEQAGPRWTELTGVAHDHGNGHGWSELVHQDDRPELLGRWRFCLATGEPLDHEYRLRLKDGEYRWFRGRATAKRSSDGRIEQWYGTLEDIHEGRLAATALRDSEQRFRLALEVGRLGVWEYNVASRRIEASDLCAQMFGLRRGADLSHYDVVLAAIHPDDRERLHRERDEVLGTGRPMHIELRVVGADGGMHWVQVTGRSLIGDDGQPRRVFGLALDVTEQREAKAERERSQARLLHLAHHDALTDLANRRLLDLRLAEAVAAASPNSKAALFCIDLDQFKAVNDQLGHEAGDRLLRHAAERLRRCVRKSDTVARYGGDEFAVLQTGIRDPMDTEILACRILQALTEPYDLDGRVIVLGGSIGISLAPDEATDPAQLRRNADSALYRAKAGGRGGHRFFEAETDVRLQAREALKLGLHDALERDELRLLYQPIVDLSNGDICGFEALLRWQHPERGLLSPEEFIPVAEETGWIVRFGRWALRKACADAALWPAPLRVAVNLSATQFANGSLEAEVSAALADAGLDAGRLELEVTETLLLLESPANTSVLRGLRKSGVRLVMDDFGTGYSSLAYLRKFRFDKIKIDKSLISGLPDHDGGDMIVRAIIGLGRSLGIAITAEGVEHEEQLRFLTGERCSQAQGYLFSSPVPSFEVSRLLERSWPAIGPA